MRLSQVRLRIFRCYRDETSIEFDDLTALVGRNDSGKSTVMEALDIFFNDRTPGPLQHRLPKARPSYSRPGLLGINPDDIEREIRRFDLLDLATYGVETTADGVLRFFQQSLFLVAAGPTDEAGRPD